MDYEKAYKESLEKASKYYDGLANCRAKDELESIFPELQESKDERIRKRLLWFLANYTGKWDYPETRMACRAWLEKQKEQKFTHHEVDESLQDAITHQMEDDGDVDDFVRRGIDDVALKYAELGASWQKEQKPVQTEDEKEYVRILKSLVSDFIRDHYKNVDITFYQKIYDWLDGRHIEQKPAEWSEEDEKKINVVIDMIYQRSAWPDRAIKEYTAWLKSLRPHPQKELSIEKAIKWLDDTFYFLDNSSGRGRDCEITTHDFDSLEEMYNSFRKAVIVDSEPRWKPSEQQEG